jgi:hypothetical protein
LKNLVLSSLLLLLLGGCSLSLKNSMNTTSAGSAYRTDEITWFRADTGRNLFKADIDIYRNHFSGMMLIKPVNETSYRVVFITEVGIKIFDIEFFRDGDFRLHYCIEKLNKRFLIKTLKSGIGLMINNIPDGSETVVMEEKNKRRMVIRIKDKKGISYCYIDRNTKKVNELVRCGTLFRKLNIRYYGSVENKLDSVAVSYYNLKLDINLTNLNEK